MRFASPALALTLATSIFASACGDDGPPPPEVIYAEFLDTGVLSYRGQYPPTETLDRQAGRTHYAWSSGDPDVYDGPRCLGVEGDPDSEVFSVETFERESDDLLIYLQGGGLCSSLTRGACLPESIGFAGLGILGTRGHPFAGYDVGYVSYCDGSLFMGDVTREDEGEIFVQRGRKNITAALDVISAQFPNPPRVVLAGLSAGAFATLFVGPMVRVYFPDAEVLVVNDSGIGITRGDREPEFVDNLLTELNAAQFIPPTCTECFEDGHAIRFVDWLLRTDPELRFANTSHTDDNVIAGTFLGVPQEWFEAELRRETAELSALYPERYATYLIEGRGHTSLVAGAVTGEVDLEQIYGWLQLFIDEDPTWGDVEQPGVP